MLKALYDYAHTRGLVLPPGYVNKTIKAYIRLTSDGRFVGIDMGDDEPVPCPDIGSMANSKDKSNVLVEKRSVVASADAGDKQMFFREALRDGGSVEPMLKVCADALDDADTHALIVDELDRHKIKPADRVSFRVGGRSILDSELTDRWWQGFRQRFSKVSGGDSAVCMITGKPTQPVQTVPPISGLAVVGGHARGDALICFDKAAFCSYGLSQATNAPVSEEAISAVKAALDHLLAGAPLIGTAPMPGDKDARAQKRSKGAPIVAGMKVVHWYDVPIPRDEDRLHIMLGDAEDDAAQEDDGDDDIPLEDDDDDSDDSAADVSGVNVHEEEDKPRQMIAGLKHGIRQAAMASEYHIMMLSGVGGRVMVRRYEHGSFDELQRRLDEWFDDIKLCALKTGAYEGTHKLTAMLIRLIKRQKSDTRLFDRLAKELAGVAPAVMMAILTGGAMPDAVAMRALAYIRGQMYESGNENAGTQRTPDAMACQWLKVYVRRKERKQGEVYTMAYCNPEHPSKAYHCGRLVAIYARLQNVALGDVNAGVVEKYYGSAIQNPALVLGMLDKLSQHHTAKLTNEGAAKWFEQVISDIYAALGDEIPAALTLEEQSYFALGYRQQIAQMIHDAVERKNKAASAHEDADAEVEE